MAKPLNPEDRKRAADLLAKAYMWEIEATDRHDEIFDEAKYSGDFDFTDQQRETLERINLGPFDKNEKKEMDALIEQFKAAGEVLPHGEIGSHNHPFDEYRANNWGKLPEKKNKELLKTHGQYRYF